MDTIDSLGAPLRYLLSLTVLAFTVATWRALTRTDTTAVRWRVAALFGGAFAVAAVFAHTPLAATLPFTFPLGMAVVMVAVFVSLAHRPTRARFEALEDGDVRALLGARITFGAFLFAAAACGQIAPRFAWIAGTGDMVVGWVALVAGGRLVRGQSPWARVVVHGIGAIDLAQVVFLAVTLVRPWSIAHGNATTTVTLPWVAVPLMLALNLHGLRSAIEELVRGRSVRGVDGVGASALDA